MINKTFKIKFSKKNQNGFSILEGILSTMLLSIGLMGGIFLMQNAVVTSSNADFNVIATQLANEKLETVLADKAMRAEKYSGITSENYPSESISYNGASGIFNRKVVVKEVSASDLNTAESGSGLKKVDVTVSWGESDEKSIQVSTLLANY